MKPILGLALALAAFAQTPILQPKPEFKAGVEYKQGSFTVVIHEERGAGCTPEMLRSGACILSRFVLIGSTDPTITNATVQVFFQTYTKGIESTGPLLLLLHQEITCPTAGGRLSAICNQSLNIPVAAIKMIRIRGSAEVETVEIGRQ